MARHVHSLGPTCAYYEEDHQDSQTQTDRSQPSNIKAQFFYVSSQPIDDPLSPLPPVSADKTTRLPPEPFSARDNAALEEAWQAFLPGQGGLERENDTETRRDIAKGIFSFPGSTGTGESPGIRSPVTPSRRSGNITGRGTEDTGSKPPPAETEVMLGPNSGAEADSRPVDAQELNQPPDVQGRPAKEKRHFSPFRHRHKGDEKNGDDPPKSVESDATRQSPSQPTVGFDSDISGRPFARQPSKRNMSFASKHRGAFDVSDESDYESGQERSRSHSVGPHHRKDRNQEKVFVPVGVSRLHLVEMPDLIMKPIYWSPINDTSEVIRATWFYKDSMLPVPAQVANRLEIGYEYMKPYAESYQEELQACIENGASAEMKVVYKLWPDEPTLSRPETVADTKELNQGVQQEATNLILPAMLLNAAADPRKPLERRLFATHSVIYTDARNAQILRPSLLPSISKNRRPLSSLRKGSQIGVAVVRGFDHKAWLKIHPNPKLDAKAAYAKVGAYMSQSGDATTRGRRMSCTACEEETEAPKVSDLVLVIHGIGQKLSERVDSFHFTHAVNGLRREFNVELSTEAVKGNVRNGTGIMILPVNWRLTVSFDEDVKASQEDADNKYALRDITPETLPGVRSLISDVMLDIPYYLSHHKDKMTSAVIREANRVYRLWCRNNPGFEDYGRVHLIAHSLGSVMAMEILSQQPTRIGKDIKLDNKSPSEKMFEFDTTNLFCCGSPSGFFLLLNNASLIPRKGRNKPGMEGEDRQPGIAGEAKYGCLAIDNLYNICHRNDPISYLQNAAVDQLYAASLQPASIPSASVGLMRRLGHTLRWAPGSASDAYTSAGAPTARPELQQLPSTVEMETHNFTREEIAEKRMYLLNDNGQIDWFLNSGGGPLEIQYLSMLSAHSSYWVLQDFVRFLVVEIGREPGKTHTLPILRAVKKREYKKGNIS